MIVVQLNMGNPPPDQKRVDNKKVILVMKCGNDFYISNILPGMMIPKDSE